MEWTITKNDGKKIEEKYKEKKEIIATKDKR